jgi:hypothetical protein
MVGEAGSGGVGGCGPGVYAEGRFTEVFGEPRREGAARRWRCVLASGGVWIELKRNPSNRAWSLRIEPDRADVHELISQIKFTELRDHEQVDLMIRELRDEGAVREGAR